MILQFALCDDDPRDLACYRGLLEEYLTARSHIEGRISAFSDAKALLAAARQCQFDIYILDVLMPGENGIRLGSRLREFDRMGTILYLTSSPDFAVESYNNRAFHYLLKPVEREVLFSVLDQATALASERRKETVLLRCRNGLRRIEVDQIVYGELVDKRLCYHLADGEILQSVTIRGAFRDAAADLLNHPEFVLCGVSFAVNLSYVVGIERSGARLKNGRLLPLSRAYRSTFTSQWLDYYLEGDG